MSEHPATLYLNALFSQLRENALKARSDRDYATEGDDRTFATGKLTGYYEVLSLAKEQALANGLDVHELGLADLEPERDLL